MSRYFVLRWVSRSYGLSRVKGRLIYRRRVDVGSDVIVGGLNEIRVVDNNVKRRSSFALDQHQRKESKAMTKEGKRKGPRD